MGFVSWVQLNSRKEALPVQGLPSAARLRLDVPEGALTRKDDY